METFLCRILSTHEWGILLKVFHFNSCQIVGRKTQQRIDELFSTRQEYQRQNWDYQRAFIWIVASYFLTNINSTPHVYGQTEFHTSVRNHTHYDPFKYNRFTIYIVYIVKKNLIILFYIRIFFIYKKLHFFYFILIENKKKIYIYIHLYI